MRQFIKTFQWLPIIKYSIESDHWFYPNQTFRVKKTYSKEIAQKQLKRIQALNKRKGHGNCNSKIVIVNTMIEIPTDKVVPNIWYKSQKWKH